MSLTLAVGAICLLLGLVLGLNLNYLIETKPLLREYKDLVEIMYNMKKQGFVPQFEIQQKKPLNPASDVVEY